MADNWEDAVAEAAELNAGVRMDIHAARVDFVTDPTIKAGQVDMNVIMLGESLGFEYRVVGDHYVYPTLEALHADWPPEKIGYTVESRPKFAWKKLETPE